MKKKLSSVLFLFFVMGLALGIAPSAAAASTMTIQGVVTNYYTGDPEKDFVVKIYCTSADNYITASTPTNAEGHYSVVVSSSTCPLGEKVMATVETDTKIGATVVNAEEGTTEINLRLLKKTVVPEFGQLGGLVALGLGVAAIIFVRLRFS